MSSEVVGVVPTTPEYYSSSYWNSYVEGQHEINRRISGDPDVPWYAHFRKHVRERRFRKALFLLCGNGWLERRLLEECPLFEEAVGVDHSVALLDEAREAAAGLPIRYYQMDVNAAAFPEQDFDLVVNLAACHHIAYLDRVLRRLCEMLPPDGYLVSFDYVGPHRNQYPYEHWNAAWRVNGSLPSHLRLDLSRRYPHLPTMLHADPTEAIHSELILESTARYFDIEEHRHAGGAIAYPLLLDNPGMQRASSAERRVWIDFLMQADLEFLAANPSASYFDYYACRPRKEALADFGALERHSADEDLREARARRNGGLYYEPSLVQTLHSELVDARLASEHRMAVILELQASRTLRSARWIRRFLDACLAPFRGALGALRGRAGRQGAVGRSG